MYNAKTQTIAPERYTAEFLYMECLNTGLHENHCTAMRNELHFVENMHFVWEAVKLFENSICVVHAPILKKWRLMHPTFKLKHRFIYKIVTNLNVRAAVLYITNSGKKTTKFVHTVYVFECWQIQFAFRL